MDYGINTMEMPESIWRRLEGRRQRYGKNTRGQNGKICIPETCVELTVS